VQQTEDGNRVLGQVARANPTSVRILDLDRFLCPTGTYQSGLRGVDPMRVDGVHFSRRGSNLVGRWIARQLSRPAKAVSTTPAPPVPPAPRTASPAPPSG
jgi:hypothetical protein